MKAGILYYYNSKKKSANTCQFVLKIDFYILKWYAKSINTWSCTYAKGLFIYLSIYTLLISNLVGLKDRTPAFKAGDPGSIPGGAIIHFFHNTGLRGVARPGGGPDKIKAIRNTVRLLAMLCLLLRPIQVLFWDNKSTAAVTLGPAG